MTNLDILDLEEAEEKIYRILLVSGQLSQGEIRIASSLNQEMLTNSIKGLITKKLVREVPGLDRRYACLLPLGNLKTELEKSVDEVAKLGSDLRETATTVIQNLETEMAQGTQSLQQDLELQKQKIDDSSSATLAKILADQQVSKENAGKLLSDLVTNEQQQVSSVGANMIVTMDNKSAKVVSALNTRLDSMDAQVEEIKVNQEVIKVQASADIPAMDLIPLENAINDTIGTTDAVTGQASDAVTTAQGKLDHIADHLKESLSNTSEKLRISGNEFHQATTATLEQTKSAIDELAGKESPVIDDNASDSGTANSSAVEKINTVIAEYNTLHEGLNQSLSEVQDKFKDYHAENSSELYSTTTVLGSNVQNLLNQTDTEMVNQTTALQTALGEMLQRETEKLQQTLQDHFTQFNQLVSGKIETTVSDLNTKRGEGKTSVETLISSSITELQESFQASVSKRETTESELFALVKEKNVGIKQTSDARFNEIIADLEGLSTTIKNQVQGVHDNQETNFSNILVTALDEISTLLTTEVAELKQYHQTNADEVRNAFTNLNQTIITNLTERVDIIKQTSQNIYETTMTNLKEAVEASNTKYLELIDTNRATAVGSVKQTERDIDGLILELKTILDAGVQDLNNQIQTLTDTIKLENNQFLDDSSSQLQLQVQSIKETGETSLSSALSISQQGNEKRISTVKGSFDTFQNSYDTTTNTISDKTRALAGVLDKLFHIQEDTDTPSIKTTAIVGKEAITSYLSDVIGRVKSKVTILVPSVDMISEEQILGMKSTAQVTIISHLDDDSDKDWIDKMHGASANVTLRSIARTDFSGQLPDFIGVEREGEEILLGTVDEGAKDCVALASASEYFVQILGNIVISDYARGKSQQLKK
jgi:sugar-specific transcriptional regulator TrmB